MLTFDDFKIAGQRLLEDRVPEEASLRNVAHEQLHNNEELVHGLEEAWGGLGRGRAPDCLLQVRVRRGVIELHGLDATQIVMVSSKLGVPSRRREICLCNQLVRLVIKIVVQVVAKQEVNEHRLALIISTQRCCLLCGKEKSK